MVDGIDVHSASSVGNGTPPDAPPESHPTTKNWKTRFAKMSKSVLDWGSATLKVVRNTGSLFGKFQKITLPLQIFFKCTKLPNIISAPFICKEIIEAIQKIFCKGEVVRGGLNLVSKTESLVDESAASIKILTTARLISEKVGIWIPIFEIVSFFVGLISIGFKAESVYKIGSLHLRLQEALERAENARDETEKATAMTTALDLVRTGGIDVSKEPSPEVVEKAGKDLIKKLSITKKAHVLERINLLRDSLNRPAATGEPGEKAKAYADSKDFFKVFAPRVRMQFWYEFAELVNKVAVTVGLFFATFTPCAIVGATILLSTAVVSLVLMAGRAMLIHKNPFDAYARSRGERVLDTLIPSRKEALSLRKKVEDLTAERARQAKERTETGSRLQGNILELKTENTKLTEEASRLQKNIVELKAENAKLADEKKELQPAQRASLRSRRGKKTIDITSTAGRVKRNHRAVKLVA